MSQKITLNIDDEEYECMNGQSVLDVCREKGIFIPTLCEIEHIEQPFGGCRVCLVEITGPRGTMVTTSCDTPVSQGMNIRTDTPEIMEGRRTAIELLLSEHTGDCIAPCSRECPASLDVQGYLAHIANERWDEAVKLIKSMTPLAISLGRACFAPCEEECRRHLVEEPISIRQEKQYAAELDIEEPWTPDIPRDSGKSVGIVGGGPAGLTAAYFLRLRGHGVTIYDMMPKLGGMMRYGIPNYRLPKNLLDKEIDWILGLGIEAKTGVKLGKDMKLEELREVHDAVFISTGAWESWLVPIEGKELSRVYGGIDFLIDHTLGKDIDLGEKVMVVGCGNTAMDVARTARRMGKEVTIAYRRTAQQAPASEEEMREAMEEGVRFEYLTNPEKICGCEVNGVSKVTCARMELGEPDASGRARPVKIEGETIDFEVNSVILAIGQSPDLDTLREEGLDMAKYTLEVNHKFATNLDGVFAAGDVTLGPCSIVECTGHAREAAFAVDAYIAGELGAYDPPENYKLPFGYVHRDEKDEEDFADWDRIPRLSMPVRHPDERVRDHDAIEMGFKPELAIQEAKRCLECGCLDRFQCKLKEYATLYGASQDAYAGFKHDYMVDDSHPHVVRDPGKCILCGSCVRTSEEHGEGVVQFVHRGFQTIVEPAFGDPLGNTDSLLVGSLSDACPTGALEEIPASDEPGPFELVEMGTSHCPGCGLGCPVTVHGISNQPLRLTPMHGHLCDIGKFGTLPLPVEHSGTLKSLEGKRINVYASPNTTLEEARELAELARSTGGELYAPVPGCVSSVNREELMGSVEVHTDSRVFSMCPVLKDLVPKNKRSKSQGDGMISLVTPDASPRSLSVVAQEGINAWGLYDMGLKPLEENEHEVLLVYDTRVPSDVHADIIIQMVSDARDVSSSADVVIPVRSWLEKEGTVKNLFGETLEFRPVMESRLHTNREAIKNLGKV
ncbi:MAG: FAD-dependent oxidoreductase [Thermoplasmata archaeon]